MNDSGIRPMEYNVLVLPKKVEEKTASGLYLPDKHREKEQFGQKMGTLVAVSPLAFSYDEWPEGVEPPKEGDTVLFSRYQADEVLGRDGETYWMMKDKAIAGVLDD